MLFSVHNQAMQQKKTARPKRDSKQSIVNSHLAERVSTLASNRSQDTKSKIHNTKDSYIREFKKTKIKLNTLSSIGYPGLEDQIKKQITQVHDLLKDCEARVAQRKQLQTQKQQLIQMQQVIRFKDETIKTLGVQIQNLKKNNEPNPNEEDSHSEANKATDTSDKQKMFKLAEQMKHQRQQLQKHLVDHIEKVNKYQKIKKLIEEIQLKYNQKSNHKTNKDQNYHGPALITYEEYKQKIKTNKEENIPIKIKRVDFYHHLSPEKQTNPSMNMKDLITRKNITMTALKNSKKKHNVEMTELIAKLDFLKDEDAHLTQKIKQKEQELASMEKKFSEKRGDKINFERNPLLHFHS